MKVFLTVGTSKFDELIRKMDAIASAQSDLKVIAQIGFSNVTPVNFLKFFRFTLHMGEYYKWADIVISHGGAGSIYDVLAHRKKAIVVPNPHLTEEHQYEIVQVFHDLGYIIKGDVDKLQDLLREVRNMKLKQYTQPKNIIPKR